MYVVLTRAELQLYETYSGDGLSDSPLDDYPLDIVEMPQEVRAGEVTISEDAARMFGILAPRPESWIGRAHFAGYFTGAVPKAKLPEHAIGFPEVDPEELWRYLQSLAKSS